jgi:hypothetical protein
VTPGDGILACVVCQSPPFDEALIVDPDDDPAAGNAVIGDGPRGAQKS